MNIPRNEKLLYFYNSKSDITFILLEAVGAPCEYRFMQAGFIWGKIKDKDQVQFIAKCSRKRFRRHFRRNRRRAQQIYGTTSRRNANQIDLQGN